MAENKGRAQTEREATNAMLHRSMQRERVVDDGGLRLAPKLAIPERQAQEERHREMLYMLDRIAAAIEAGNKLTTDVMERT